MILQNSTDIKTEYFTDKNNDLAPVDIRYEKHTINPNGLIQLRNIPSPLHTVFTVKGKDGVNIITYNKVETITNKYDFTVDYINGILTFHSSQANREIQVSYTNSIGRLNISADRIFTKIDNQGSIIETLGTLLEEGRQTLSDLEVLGGATKVITEMEGYIESIKELTGNIIEGDNINSNLVKSTDTAKSTNTTLNSTINNANNQISEMNEWVENHGDIVNLDNRVDETENKLTSVSTQLAEKAPLDYVRESTLIKPINHTEFDTETKKLLTGDKVPVVGEKAVGRENLKEKAVGVINVDHSILKNSLTNLLSTDLYTGTGKNGATIDLIENGVVKITSSTTYGTFNRIIKTDSLRKYIIISKCKVVTGDGVTVKHTCYNYSETGENLGQSGVDKVIDISKDQYTTLLTKFTTKIGTKACRLGVTVNKECSIQIAEQIILDVTGLDDETLNSIDFLKFGYFNYGIENTALYSELSNNSKNSEKAKISDFAIDGNFAKTTDNFTNLLGRYEDIRNSRRFVNNGVDSVFDDELKEVTSIPNISWGSLLIWTPGTDETAIKYNRKYKLVVKMKTKDASTVKGTFFMYDKGGVQLGALQTPAEPINLTNDYVLYTFEFTVNKSNCYKAKVGIVNKKETEPFGTFVMKDFMLIDVTDINISDDYLNQLGGYWSINPKIAFLSERSVVAERALALDESFQPGEGFILTRWKGKKALVIGDSITAAGIWQLQLEKMLGMEVKTHAKGGVGIIPMVDGDKGLDGDYDNEINSSGTLYPLNTTDVQDVDLIVVLPGYNERDTEYGVQGDLYPAQKTIVGKMQYLFNRIYEELGKANNLKCKILVATPHCFGKYPYSNANGYEEHNGKMIIKLVDSIIETTNLNNIPVCDLWRNSGVNRFTWSVYSASSSIDNTKYTKYELNSSGEVIGETLLKYVKGQSYYQIRDGVVVLEEYTGSAPYPYNGDQLHLNTSGYTQIGECIVGSIIRAYGY